MATKNMESNGAPIGMRLCIEASLPNQIHQTSGYEVVGVSAWGDMHTSVCYSVRDKFIQEFGAKFNADGLFDSLSDARLAAEMNNNADGGAVGDAFWFPVRISQADSMVEGNS